MTVRGDARTPEHYWRLAEQLQAQAEMLEEQAEMLEGQQEASSGGAGQAGLAADVGEGLAGVVGGERPDDRDAAFERLDEVAHLWAVVALGEGSIAVHLLTRRA